LEGLGWAADDNDPVAGDVYNLLGDVAGGGGGEREGAWANDEFDEEEEDVGKSGQGVPSASNPSQSTPVQSLSSIEQELEREQQERERVRKREFAERLHIVRERFVEIFGCFFYSRIFDLAAATFKFLSLDIFLDYSRFISSGSRNLPILSATFWCTLMSIQCMIEST
jgi:hypothetical protein